MPRITRKQFDNALIELDDMYAEDVEDMNDSSYDSYKIIEENFKNQHPKAYESYVSNKVKFNSLIKAYLKKELTKEEYQKQSKLIELNWKKLIEEFG